MAISGIELTERPWAGSADSRLFASDPGPGNPNVGRAAKPAAAPMASPAAPAAPTTTEKPSLRARAVVSGSNALGKATRTFGPAAAGFAALGHLGDYRIDDPDVDSSAMGTLRAVGQGDFAGAGRSLSKGMLEAGMDLGSMAANALDYVVPGKAPVSTAYDRTLRNQFGSQLIGATGRLAAEGAPVDAPTTLRKTAPGAPTRTRPEDTFVGPPESARSPVGDTVVSGARSPAPNPGDVTRNGNSYEGTNVRGNITINGFAPGAGLNLGSGPNAQNMAAADALADSQLRESVGRIQTAQPSASPASLRRERLMDQLQSRELGARKTARLGLAAMDQQEQAANQRYATDSSLRGQMYSSDAQLGVKRMEMQQRLRQQQMLGEIHRGSGGDLVKAARAAASLGLDGKPFLDMAAANQTLTQNNVKDARSTFDNMFTRDGKNGPERDENAEAMANQLADQIAPGYSTMSAEQRAAARPKIIEATRMVQGMNTLRNSTWAQKFGIDDPTPGYSQLPDLNGALVDSTGFLEGLLKPDVGRSDTKITLRDGSVRYLPRGSLTEAQERILEENGAKRAN